MAEVEYKSNSHKSKERKKETEKKDVRSKLLADRPVKKPENPDVKSIILGDLGMIFTELKDEVIIPGIMDLGKDMWEDTGERLYELISGRPSNTRSRRKRKSSNHVSYDGCYKGNKSSSNKRRKKPKKISYGRYSIYDVEIDEDEVDPEDVIDAIFEQMDEYKFCSIKDYYDFAHFNDWEWTDYPENWGWELDEDGNYPFTEGDLEIEEYKNANGEIRYNITGFSKPTRFEV